MKWVATYAAVSVLAVGAATTAVEATAPPATGDASGEPLVVGTIGTDQATGFALPQVADGFEAFADYINANGGIDGHPLQVNRCNDEGTPEQSQACARQQADDDSVVAIAGSWSPLTGSVAMPTLEEAGLPYICAYPLDAGELASSVSYCISSGAVGGFVAVIDYLIVEKGAQKINLVLQESPNSHAIAESLVPIADALGAEIGEQVFVAPGAADYVPAVTQVSSGDPDYIFQGFDVQSEVRLLQAADTLGVTIPFAAIGGAIDNSVLSSGTASMEGMIFNQDSPVLNTDDPEVQLFVEAMTAAGHEDEIGEQSLNGWLTGRVLQAAVEEIGFENATRESINTFLQSTPLTTVPLLPNLDLGTAPTVEGIDLSALANATTNIAIIEGDSASYIAENYRPQSFG